MIITLSSTPSLYTMHCLGFGKSSHQRTVGRSKAQGGPFEIRALGAHFVCFHAAGCSSILLLSWLDARC